MECLYKPYTNKQYADFVVANKGRKLCKDDEKVWFEDYPIIEPTKEEISILREQAYIQNVDKITCHINRLKDEEQTPEVIAEIASLVEERKAKVEEIKQRFPYPVEENEEVIEDGLQR